MAYRRTTDPALRALAVGIGLVTIGVVLGGVLHRAVDVRLAVGVQNVSTAADFAVLADSLYAERDDAGSTDHRRTAV
ncbi:hypothetical protein I7X12_01705 [Halosimplex litoreum]|uniref:Uncharacterized protein n=1 Tax=Halosimplex litoreum TaxID=1198301 RepID=A0A7U3WBK7_9EURY|nr:hypothetical protein I7X12_01705 [Halosimplex litoreum]